MSDSPYRTMFEQPTDGIFQQELITYRIKDGMLSKVTVVRKFFKDDYYDNETVEPLCAIKKV